MKMLNKSIYLIVNLLKKSKIRGRGKAIKILGLLFKCLKQYSHSKYGYLKDIILDLSDDAAVGFFLNDGLPHEAGLLKVFKYFSNSNKIFWDIGTNYGIYPWVFQNESFYCKIHCFEPNPKLYSILIKSFTNDKNKIFLYNIGLGEKKGTMVFHYNHNRSDLGSFLTNANKKNTSSLVVNIDTIDNIRNFIGKPDVIKIDVEGFEMFVLKGYENLNTDYPIITLEWIESFQEFPFEDLLKLFNNSWHFYYIGNNGLLYKIKNNICGSDILFISENNESYNKVFPIIGG